MGEVQKVEEEAEEAEKAEKEDRARGVALEGDEVAVGAVAEFGAGVAVGNGGGAMVEAEAIGDAHSMPLLAVALAKVKVFVV